MKFRKVVSLFAAAAMAVSSFTGLATTASAATAADIVPITSSATYWFEDYMTAGLSKDALIADSHFYTPTGNTYSSGKGSNSDSGTSHLNCLRVKNVQDMLQFSVSKPAEITVYTQKHGSRGIVATTTVPSTAYTTYDDALANSANLIAVQPSNTTAWTFAVDEATDFCFSNYGGDFYIAGISVAVSSTEPSISISPTLKTLAVGESVELSATTENADGAEVVWTSDDEGVATVENGKVSAVSAGNATITAMINVGGVEYTASCEITVVDTGTVTFAATGAEGFAPASITKNNGESITLPINRTYYVEGSTLTGWSDGTTTYAPGASYTVNGDVTLTAVFTENTAALGDGEATVAFDLQTKNGTPVVGWQNSQNILVYQASINGTSIDVKMDVNTSPGKLANANWTDWAQVNGGTTFTVPALDGAVVKMDTIYNDATYTINGTEYTQAGQSQGENVTITGADTITIVAGETSGSYWRGFTVTYPKVETEEPEETDAPSTEAVVLKYPESAITGGNHCDNTSTFIFVDGVDTNIASFFADPDDPTKIDADLVTGYKNYIVGTNTGYDSPYITADLPAGTYKVYFLGYNHGKEVNATIASTGETVYDTTGGVQFAYQSDDASRILKLYTLEFTLSTAVTGETITFDSTQDSWLPDLYAIVLTNQSAAPEATPTPEPDLSDVMPDFAYQFCNTNSTELTSTTSGTYYLDKDGKLCDSASYQTVTLTNVRYHNDHGLSSSSGSTYKFRAMAPFKVIVGSCTYDDGSGKLVVKDLDGNTVYTSETVTFNDACYKANSANVTEFSYTGTGVVDVEFSTPSGCYFPYLAKTSIDVDTISGSLINASDLNEGTITFTSQTTGIVYTGTISNGTYSVVVPTGDTYDVLLTSTGYVAVTTYTANGDNSSADLTCTAAVEMEVSGTIANAPSSADILTFTAANNSANTKKITLDAGATSYTASLMPDTYTVTSSVGTLSPISSESFLVVGATTKNLYYPEVIPTATSSTVTVYKDQAVSGTNYHTIADAVAGIKAAGYSESTILLKSGVTYEEQVKIQINGVTLKTDGDAKATISWYYGIGYTYYSLGSDGYYDKDRAMTKVGKLERDPDRWGAVVRVTGNNFTAENIIFENTFNQRATAAEIADGVVYNGCQAITVDRTASGFVADTRSSTERAAAIAIEGRGTELYNCEFIGSQDTFFTGGTAYVKDCAITGNTDYIFGGGSIVFDNCDLIWGGYSDQAVGGYITASNGSDAGYLFRDCTIKDGNRQKAKGSFGRDWGGTNAHAYFINCTDATEKGVSGWSNMGGAVKDGTADLHVFDLANPNGYKTSGSSDKYNITAFTFADAEVGS